MEHLKIKWRDILLRLHRKTEVAIKEVMIGFERALAKSLHLTRVSAPLFVLPQSYERYPTELNVQLFGIKEQDDACAEIVHSLANGSDMP